MKWKWGAGLEGEGKFTEVIEGPVGRFVPKKKTNRVLL